MKRRILPLIFALCLACIAILSVPAAASEDEQWISGISLDKSTLELAAGSSETLSATVTPPGLNVTVTWSSSSAAVASVDQNGRVTGNRAGTVTITAKAGNFTDTCTVTVVLKVTSVKLNQSEMTLNMGDTGSLRASVTPSNAVDGTLRWTRSMPSVATVEGTGDSVTIRAVSEGTTIITAAAGNFSAECVVSVIIPVTAVTLDKTTLSLSTHTPKGRRNTLIATGVTLSPDIGIKICAPQWTTWEK